MAATKLILSIALAFSLLSIAASASAIPGSQKNLAARLLAAGGAIECWDSLLELRACTGEVILFFLNGETYLGPSCCRAIRVIEQHCWPSMLGALGFTSEEGDVLIGYCNASESNPPPPAPSSPGPSPATAFKYLVH